MKRNRNNKVTTPKLEEDIIMIDGRRHKRFNIDVMLNGGDTYYTTAQVTVPMETVMTEYSFDWEVPEGAVFEKVLEMLPSLKARKNVVLVECDEDHLKR